MNFLERKLTDFLDIDEDKNKNLLKEISDITSEDYFNTPIKELSIYKNYLRFFNTSDLSEFIESSYFENIDLDLLIKLVVSHLGSEYDFILDKNKKFDLVLEVSSEEMVAKKGLKSLFPFQLRKLYPIYFSSLINSEIYILKKKSGYNTFVEGRKEKLNKFYNKKEVFFKRAFYSIISRGI